MLEIYANHHIIFYTMLDVSANILIKKYDIGCTYVHALITSKLDYCNGLLFGMPDSLIARLQRVQNACARLVYGQSKFTSTSPLQRELH